MINIDGLFLSSDKTFKRKINEILIAINLETKYSKEEILEGYLNTINYGGVFGIENASQYYFNKSASELNLEESIILAGIPKAPNKYNPVTDYDASIKRAQVIAKVMLNNEVIDKDTYNKLFVNKVEIYGKRNDNDLNMLMYYQDAVYNELENIDSIPDSLIESGGIKIYTSLNMDIQSLMEEKIIENMDNSNMQVASIIINPHTGGVMAMTGGIDYTKSQFNRAISSKRQVGSTMKPFLYYAALENGFNVSNTFYSTKTEFHVGSDIYSPKNFNDKYAETDVSMAYALAVSDNIYAVKTHLYLGNKILYNTLKDFSFTSNLNNNISLALGTSEVYLDELTTAYSKIASMGKDVKRKYIDKITDTKGNIIYEANYDYKTKFDETTCYILSETMTNVFDPKIRINTSPTASSISSKLSSKYAAKSGSTDYDNWMIGFNKNITLGIWAGYDDNIVIDNSETRFIKNIWADVMENYNKKYKDTWYETPNNVIGIKLNPINGKIANDNEYSKYLYFENNNLPIEINKTLNN